MTLCLMLGGCTVYGDWFGGDNKSNYQSGARRTQPLDVPPDLSQLQKDSRYMPQGGVITASDLNKPGTPQGAASAPAEAAPASGPAVVALNTVNDLRIDHSGDQRWLATKMTPEQAWPKVKDFWLAKGFTLTVDDPQAGILQTDWLEDRTRLPGGVVHDTVGKVFSSLFDSGMRDRYRTRLERQADGGTEIYITHFGAMEEVTGFQKSEVEWVPRPSDPGLESQMLNQLMLSLGGLPPSVNLAATPASAPVAAAASAPVDEQAANAARIASAAALPPIAGANAGPPRARIVPDQPGATMQVDDNFDRTWRRVGLALDHGGFTVEDRDRAQGLYFVRFVDAKQASKDEPGILTKIEGWFGHTGPNPVGKYRISIKGNGNVSTVTVLNDQGQPDKSDNPQRMVALLVDELK
jgi:outer membrane protein assembly factor BamC